MESLCGGNSVKNHVLNFARKIGPGKRDDLDIRESDPSGRINPAFSFENIVDEREIKINAEMNDESKFVALNYDNEAQDIETSNKKPDCRIDLKHYDSAKTEILDSNADDKILTITKADLHFKPNRDSNSEFDSSKSKQEFERLRSKSTERAGYTSMRCRSNIEQRSKLASRMHLRRASFSASHAAVNPETDTQIFEEQRNMHGTPQELQRSDYSLVSCGELTAGSLDVWRALPDQVKYDPALAPFRELYEKEHGRAQAQEPRNGTAPSKRLPLVQSAPNIGVPLVAAGGKDDVVHSESGDDADYHNHEKGETPTQLEKVRHYVKLTSLLACWVFFTVVFMLSNEREAVVRHSSVAQDEIKNYYLDATYPVRILIQLEGPFWSEQAEKTRNSSDTTEATTVQTMDVWLERWTLSHRANTSVNPKDILHVQKSISWSLTLLDEDLIDFSVGETRSRVLAINASDSGDGDGLHQQVLRIRTNSNRTTPFTLTYTVDPLEQTSGVIYAALLLCGLYGLIIFDVINRTLAAVITSTTALAVLAVVGERPSLPELVSWLDAETLLLLFSMMLLVAIMSETGLFDYLAVFTFSVTKGKMWPLINLLCFITAIVSTVLDNVTTVLLMTPVTIRLCEVMQLNPVPILMAMVLYSNIGGTATAVGDPPNVIIASNADVINSGINFANFTLHMSLGILLVSVQSYFQLRFIYRDVNKLRLTVPKDIQELRQQITVWRRAAASLASYSRDEDLVRAALDKKVAKLSARLRDKLRERKKRAVPKEEFESMLTELQMKYKIRDKVLLIKASVAIAFVVAVFFLHSIPELKRISLGWTALLGAILLLILADREDMESILNRVEWSTLLFFAALFVLMEALSKLGLISWIGGLTESLILQVDEGARLAVSIVLMLWVSGLASAFVDNIPLTTMMIRVVTSLGNNPTLGLPMAPLIWALSFGACLGGNGTLIGASANVVTAGVAEQHGYRFTFMEFFKVGFPLMLGHLVVATGYLLMCHCVFTWH